MYLVLGHQNPEAVKLSQIDYLAACPEWPIGKTMCTGKNRREVSYLASFASCGPRQPAGFNFLNVSAAAEPQASAACVQLTHLV